MTNVANATQPKKDWHKSPIFLGILAVMCVLGLLFSWVFLFFAVVFYFGIRNIDINHNTRRKKAYVEDHIRGQELWSTNGYEHGLVAETMGLTGNDLKLHANEACDGHVNSDKSVIQGYLRFAGTFLPPGAENLHIEIVASPGAGKSVSLRGLLSEIRKRGDRCIIVDNGYEFHDRFGQPDDLILSAFDPSSQKWDLCNEAKLEHEWHTLTKSVIPEGTGNDKSWNQMAAALLANIAIQTDGDNKTILDAATKWSPAQLEPILRGTESEILLQEGGERLLTNIRSVFATYLGAWKYMQSGDFSLRDYIMGDDPRWLWLPFKESEFKISNQLIATWVDIIVSAGLDRKEGQSPKTWVIIDELDTLGELSSLIDATTKLRKRNMPIVVAFQTYTQIETRYGRERARTLMSCFSTKLMLRTIDGELAELMSKDIGEKEVWEKQSTAQGAGKTKVMTRLVLPAELQSLPNLKGYLKVPGDYPVVKVTVPLPD
jgi:hypothetical protein